MKILVFWALTPPTFQSYMLPPYSGLKD